MARAALCYRTATSGTSRTMMSTHSPMKVLLVSHPTRIVHCSGPQEPHALDGISRRPRTGDLDAVCPICAGYGQWNTQIDLISQRSIRHCCTKCDGRGWIETGDDLVPSHDIDLSDDGHPKWVRRLNPSDDVE